MSDDVFTSGFDMRDLCGGCTVLHRCINLTGVLYDGGGVSRFISI